MVSTDDTAHWFSERCFVKAFSFIRKKTSQFHNFMRHDAVFGSAAAPFIRVSRGVQTTFVIQRRLLCEFIANLKLIFPFIPHLCDHTGKLMSDDYRIGIYILRTSLVRLSLLYQFVRGHTDTVTHDFDQNLIIFNLWKFKGFQSQIIFSIHTNGFCLHNKFLLFFFLFSFKILWKSNVSQIFLLRFLVVDTNIPFGFVVVNSNSNIFKVFFCYLLVFMLYSITERYFYPSIVTFCKDFLRTKSSACETPAPGAVVSATPSSCAGVHPPEDFYLTGNSVTSY